ncbi:MAG: NTP transferase domain-containing protein [Acidiferrobacteraceae bacterium]
MNETSSPREHITGVILAGGRSRRMGGIDKGLVPFQGRPMVERVLRVLRTDVSALLINACPLVGSGLVHRLYWALEHEQAQISVAHDGERMHPVFALIRRDLLPDLLAFLDSGERKIDRWYNRHRLAVANFDDTPQWFQNVNSPEERTELEASVPWS